MKLYLHQTVIDPDTNKNFEKLKEVFEKKLRVDLIVCPEVFLTGFQYENLNRIARENKTFLENIQDLCLAHRTGFLGSFFWKEGDAFYNRAFFVSETGDILGAYNKQKLIPAFKEDKYLSKGNKLSIFSFKEMRVGIAICYDLRFPEIFRKYASREVDIVFLLAQWPETRIDHMITLSRARAIENQCYFIVVNATGSSQNIKMGGHSLCIDPTGKIILDLESTAHGEQVQVHLSDVLKWREEFRALYEYSRPSSPGAKLSRWLFK
ncbi:MAG: hypothetical protein OEV66_05800 [Spirochaetia bacterium]|nr:hypothetical protein [Spirochaetia bacterium]